MKNIISCEVRLNPREVRLKRTSENSELGKTQISFLGGGEHWWVWQGVGVWIRSWGRVWRSGIDHGSRVWGSGLDDRGMVWGSGIDHVGSGCGGLD